MGTGAAPRFFTGPDNWDSIFEAGRTFSDCPIKSEDVGVAATDLVDPRLAVVFQDLQHVARLTNYYVEWTLKFKEDMVILIALSSIQSRLLRLDGELVDTLSECIRLAMLAFLTTTFQVPGERRVLPYGPLAVGFRDSCRAVDASVPDIRDIFFWVLMVGAISVLAVDGPDGPDEPWLLPKWDIVSGPEGSWEAARDRLHAVMWVDCFHDELGREAFTKLTARDAS